MSAWHPIEEWLDTVAHETPKSPLNGKRRHDDGDDDDDEYAAVAEPKVEVKPARRRGRLGLESSPRKRQRRALASMDANANNVKTNVVRRSSPRKTNTTTTGGGGRRGRPGGHDTAHAEAQASSGGHGRSLEEGGEDMGLRTPRQGHHTATVHTLPQPPPPVFAAHVVMGEKPPRAASPTRSTSSYASSSMQSAGRRGGTSSPVKNPSDLLFADHPLRFDPPASMELPAHIKSLDARLKACKAGVAVIPHAVKHRLDLGDETIYDWYIDPACPRPRLDRELDELQEICQATLFAKQKGASESSWNEEVHSRLFREALRIFPGVRHHNVTSARPCKEFLPKHLASGSFMESKLVDYTVNLDPDSGGIFEKRILDLLNRESAAEQRQCITQTLYNPVRLSPAAFSVETKSGQGKDDDARMQLGIWVGAHFRRLRSLLHTHYGEDARARDIPPHPLVIVNVNVFAIMYAMEEDGQTWVFPGPQLDVPSTVLDGYKCLAALRSLAEWADTTFRSWVEGILLPQIE